MEIVSDYGDPDAEYAALRHAVGVCDLGFRGRLCLTGADRVRLLNGQVTNDVRALSPGRGCAAAFCGPKGKLVADVAIFALPEELLLDFEPGLSAALAARLEHHIVAEDVQVVDVTPHYGLLSVQGPRSGELLRRLGLFAGLPGEKLAVETVSDPTLGELYLIHRPRTATPGADLFVPGDSQEAVLDHAAAAARDLGGRLVGFDALDLRRFEAGIPRFPVDMDTSHLPPEAGLDREAISYTKGCYTGQETIARLRTYGQVAKALRGLRFPEGVRVQTAKGEPLFRNDREVGYVTSARFSPEHSRMLAMGYLRREANAPGTQVVLRTGAGEFPAEVVSLPFTPPAGTMDAPEASR